MAFESSHQCTRQLYSRNSPYIARMYMYIAAPDPGLLVSGILVWCFFFATNTELNSA